MHFQVFAEKDGDEFVSADSEYGAVRENLANELARIDQVGVSIFMAVGVVDFF